jgi:beta-lactam-binding protein with PASTA domain
MKRFLVYLVIVIIFFVIGLVLANFVIMPSLVHQGEEITVPNVCNLPLNAALEELEKCGLDGVVTEQRYDPVIEKNRVIIQEPLPDEKVKQKRIINLTISLGPETIKIPYLAGVDYEKGELIIRRHGLVIESVDSVFSDSIAPGRIVATIPEFGTEIMNGDSIHVIVSKGLILKMPQLIGMQVREAEEMVKKMGLVIGEIKKIEASGTSGEIVVQNPESGQVVKTGDVVTLMAIQ